jgi:hypothetical protein
MFCFRKEPNRCSKLYAGLRTQRENNETSNKQNFGDLLPPDLLNHCFQTAVNNREVDFVSGNLHKSGTCNKQARLYTSKKNFQVFKLRE